MEEKPEEGPRSLELGKISPLVNVLAKLSQDKIECGTCRKKFNLSQIVEFLDVSKNEKKIMSHNFGPLTYLYKLKLIFSISKNVPSTATNPPSLLIQLVPQILVCYSLKIMSF